MAINFPSNPTSNQTHTSGDTTWVWNGVSWEVQPISAPSFTNITVTGTITGTVTGTVSNIDNHSINDLNDVSTGSPTNAQVLSYNASSGQWVAATLSSTFTGGTVPNPITITNSAATTDATSGALIVTGGIGVSGGIHTDGDIVLDGSFQAMRNDASLRFYDADNSNYVGFKAPTNATSSVTWVLPSADGTSGQVLKTNGSGVLSWATEAGGGAGGTTPPGGSNTYIQFNNAGAFGGESALTYNSGTQTITVPILVSNGNITSSGVLSTTNTTASTTTTTGALKIAGGAGIAGQLNVGGATNKFTATTASTSTTTGAMVIAGGLAVAGRINVGSTVSADTDPANAEHLTNKRYVDSNILAFSMAFGV